MNYSWLLKAIREKIFPSQTELSEKLDAFYASVKPLKEWEARAFIQSKTRDHPFLQKKNGIDLFLGGAKMMELIDNKSSLLGDDLRKDFKFRSKLKIVASFFTYAFEVLKQKLSQIDELEFIFPVPTFTSEGVKGMTKKEAKEFSNPKQLAVKRSVFAKTWVSKTHSPRN